MTDKNNPNQVLLEAFNHRVAQTLDQGRENAVLKRHSKGYQTARQNLALLCEQSSFNEYGQFAVAAQRQRQDYETLKSSTAADGVITGIGEINAELIEGEQCQAAVIINDYMVLAGTQGYYHHLKIDRMLDVAKKNKLPVIMYTEGGGGRPGDTDITTVNSGLQCQSFSSWAGLSGVIPRIAVNNGYCFAGNAALFGAADITIATKQSWIGMAGPAMIEGGGLGVYHATEIGPIEVQSKNGVVDIVVDDEVQGAQVAKQCLGYFQGRYSSWKSFAQTSITKVLPDDRRYVYDIRKIINLIADQNTFTELKPAYGGAIITGFIRIEGRPIGLIASDCKVLGGAIDVDAAQKSAEFMRLCNEFSLPMISLCDTPGFMVGPEHEKQGAARKLSQMFVEGAKLKAPLISVVIRKCYGLGAQAMLGGSTSRPDYTISWPTGEFGPMGLEGAVKLGFKKELAEQKDAATRKALFDKLLAKQYQQGQASEVASVLEIDAVIDPLDTRATLINTFNQLREKKW